MSNEEQEEYMKPLFKPEDVEQLAKQVLDRSFKDINDKLTTEFYDQMDTFINEHYTNASDRIKDKVIEQIANDYVNAPDHYKFKKIRETLFKEHKDELAPYLVDEAIENSVSKVMNDYTHLEHWFAWKHNEMVATFISKHWGLFENEERTLKRFAQEIENRDRTILYLQEKLYELDPTWENLDKVASTASAIEEAEGSGDVGK